MEALRVIDRRGLRERIEGVRPSIVALYAPAGYGKSTFLHLMYQGADPVVCDCEGLRDDLDLARRLFPEMAGVLSDGARTAAERLDLAIERFKTLSGRVVILDRARHIARHPPALEFLSRLLHQRPASVTVVISSRVALPLRLSRFVAPHEVVVLRASDLAFDPDEIRALFATYSLDATVVRRIADVSRGWPLALFLMMRFAREHRLAAIAGGLQDATCAELRDYINDEILALFDDATRKTLFACAALPNATEREILDVFPDALSGNALAGFAQDSPFLMRNGAGAYSVHPILGAMLLEHQEERRRLAIEQIAIQREAEGHHIRAAELQLAAGNADSAAAMLARHDILADGHMPPEFIDVLDQLDPPRLARYPHLWGMSAALRMFREPMEGVLDEAQSVWRTIPAAESLRERYPIFVARVLLMGFLGMLEAARAEIELALEAARGSKFERHLGLLRAFITARAGNLTQAQIDIDAATSLQADPVAAFLYLTLGAEIARPQGDRMQMQLLQRGLERAASSKLESVRAMLEAQILIGAWLTGDDSRFAQSAAELQAAVERGFTAFAYLAATSLGREHAPSRTDVPESVIYGTLIHLADMRDERKRAQLAREADTNADALNLPFLKVLTAIAVALTDDALFDEYMARARSASAAVESPELKRALDCIAHHRAPAGMLDAFVSRISRDGADINPPVEVSLSCTRVRIDGAPVELAGRELELMLALALRPETSSRARLAALLWPDLDENAARNAFSVCLHRLRAKLPRQDAIERECDGYRLHADSSVDLWDVDRTLAKQRKKGALSDRDRSGLERLWHQLVLEPSVSTERWEWFEPVLRRLRECRIAIAHALGDDALARNDVQAALRYADDALVSDACDEQAAEIGIRAHLSAGDRAAAMRRYRKYRKALQAELGAEPSFALTALVTTA